MNYNVAHIKDYVENLNNILEAARDASCQVDLLRRWGEVEEADQLCDEWEKFLIKAVDDLTYSLVSFKPLKE